MTLEEIQNTAFFKWLLLQPTSVAERHLDDCLVRGPDNIAWALFEALESECGELAINHELPKTMLNALRDMAEGREHE